MYKFITIFLLGVLLACLTTTDKETTHQQIKVITTYEKIVLQQAQTVYGATVTIYYPTKDQCDNTPNVTADGTKFNINHASSYKYCALSRDLLKRWGGPFAYGDTIHIYNIESYSGTWIVKDTMHKRWRNRVDLLVDIGTQPIKYTNAKLLAKL